MSVPCSSNKDATFFYGFSECLQTRRPYGPSVVTQALLLSVLITLRTLFHLLLFYWLFGGINKQS